ncbi:MAG TPA: hypothetical protein VFQ77_04955 [Pseudonocardiaceae bacterium]|jgi:hypothetical protein|nr:hypothetical protein [Pseudonocardiaceae bacterium]
MSAALSFSEIEGQEVELLPTRTVLSCYAGGGYSQGYGYGYGYDYDDDGSQAFAVNSNYNSNYIDNSATGGSASSVFSLLGSVTAPPPPPTA